MTVMSKTLVLFLSIIGSFLIASCEPMNDAQEGIPLSCFDGFKDGDEIGVDCGGSCDSVCPIYENPIGGEIIWRTVLKTGMTYTLTKPLIIRDQSLLEIQAGVTIKVVPHIGAYIAIAQGGQLLCHGNALQPIVFESLNQNAAPGEWAGIIALGKASTNYPTPQMTSVGSYLYGGLEDYGNSIKLNYVSIKDAGETIHQVDQPALGLYAVGYNSSIDQVEISNCKGAAINVVGGTPDLRKLYIHHTGKGIVSTAGWRGSIDEVYFSQIQSNPILFDNPVDQLTEPRAEVTMDSISFIGPTSTAVISLLTKGAILSFTNGYMDRVATFISVDQSSKELISLHQIHVSSVEFVNPSSTFSLLYPKDLDTGFITEGTTNGAGVTSELPAWASWIN